MAYRGDILWKQPWLLEYYYPSSGSRFMALRCLYENENEINICIQKKKNG